MSDPPLKSTKGIFAAKVSKSDTTLNERPGYATVISFRVDVSTMVGR